jgi:hypothetical protein
MLKKVEVKETISGEFGVFIDDVCKATFKYKLSAEIAKLIYEKEILNDSGATNANAEVVASRKSEIFGNKNFLGERLDAIDGELLKRWLNPEWFGAVGDGVTNDSQAFLDIENEYDNSIVYLNNQKFIVNTLPTKNIYVYGSFIINGKEQIVSETMINRTAGSNVIIGTNAAPNATNAGRAEAKNLSLIAIGRNALGKTKNSFNNIAIGIESMANLEYGEYNLAIGKGSLFSLNKENANNTSAMRNISIGDNAQRFNKTGERNVSIGRNSLQCNPIPRDCTAIGLNALSGQAPIWLDDKTIVNNRPETYSNTDAFGSNVLRNSTGSYNFGAGAGALEYLKKGNRNVAIGAEAMQRAEFDVGINGNGIVYETINTNFSISNNSIFLLYTNPTIVVGAILWAKLGKHETQFFTVKAIESGRLRLTNILPNVTLTNETGTAIIYNYTTNSSGVINNDNIAFGVATSKHADGSFNVAIGNYANMNNKGNEVVALGHNAARKTIAGNDVRSASNIVALGSNSPVTGDNQVQIGNSRQVPYAYQALQLRSDRRDKVDIKNTSLGLEFINKLRPVDYKYNFREDYIRYDVEGNVEKLKSDGSKKRTRLHHGLIAQDIQKIIEETGVDFGGFQDHSKNGGDDVLSIAYEELIAPLVKAIQELTEKVNVLEQNKKI